MEKFAVIVVERESGDRWTHTSDILTLREAEEIRRSVEASMPGAVVEICDRSDFSNGGD